MKRSNSPQDDERKRMARIKRMEKMEAAARGAHQAPMHLNVADSTPDKRNVSLDRNTRFAADFLSTGADIEGNDNNMGTKANIKSGRAFTTGNFFAQREKFQVDQSVNLMDTSDHDNGGRSSIRRTSFVDIFIGGNGMTSGSGTSKRGNVVTTWRSSTLGRVMIGLVILCCMAFLALSVPYLVTSQPRIEGDHSEARSDNDNENDTEGVNTVVPGDSIENKARAKALTSTLLSRKGSEEDILNDKASSAFQALRWLTDHDPIQLDKNDPKLLPRFAIATFYFATHPSTTSAHETGRQVEIFSEWAHSYNWMSDRDVCKWYGVDCKPVGENNEMLEVVHLNVTANLLQGTIPIELQSLSNLVLLDLSGNQLSGTIPTEVCRLSKLKYLLLQNNILTGNIPEQIQNLEGLYELFLSTNKLTGPIPSTNKLTNLRALYLGSNDLVGQMPDLATLKNINYLHLDDNYLSGQIAVALGMLTTLQDLRLDRNQFTGKFPPELASNTDMRVIYLGNNKLNGTLPDFFDNLVALTDLQVHDNFFDGPLPVTFEALTNLRRLTLKENKMTGTLPPEWSGMTNLEALVLDHNDLVGPIPSSWGKMTKLKDLLLEHNFLQRGIPSEIGNLIHMRDLRLNHNAFNGRLPSTLGQMTNLRKLLLSKTVLTGTVPLEICALKQVHLNTIEADCRKEIECSCCTKCF